MPRHAGGFRHTESRHNWAKPVIFQNSHFSYIQSKITYNIPKCSEWNQESTHTKIVAFRDIQLTKTPKNHMASIIHHNRINSIKTHIIHQKLPNHFHCIQFMATNPNITFLSYFTNNVRDVHLKAVATHCPSSDQPRTTGDPRLFLRVHSTTGRD